MGRSDVADFYAGRSVFLTGATGFVGKVLVEKLLRSCPEVARVYLLIRGKRGAHIDQRLKDLTDSKVFDDLRENAPSSLDKLVGVAGDVSQDGLGLSDQDVARLSADVSVVFHSAARITFDTDLAQAVQINIRGTQRIVALCRRLPHLKAFVHASTCYVHPEKPLLDEVIYDGPVPLQELLDGVDSGQPQVIQQLIDRILLATNCTNVYSGTKAVTEQWLRDTCNDLPLSIVRPSIVTAAAKEPMPGWIDNIKGPPGVIVGASMGFLRAFRYEPTAVGDIIPVDFCVNLMLVAAWHRSIIKPETQEIFNCATGDLKPLTWGECFDQGMDIMMNYPIKNMFWYPSRSNSTNMVLHTLEKYVYHTLPAYFIDGARALTGRTREAVRQYQRAHRLMDCLESYSVQQWRFTTRNIVKLIGDMSDYDREAFDFDVRRLDWLPYIETYILGVRQFIHKEDLTTLADGRRTQNKLYWIRMAVHVTLLVLLLLALRFVASLLSLA